MQGAASTSTPPTFTASVTRASTRRPSTSIHLYSPALWRMGHYEPGPRGMRRTGITYADELLDVV